MTAAKARADGAGNQRDAAVDALNAQVRKLQVELKEVTIARQDSNAALQAAVEELSACRAKAATAMQQVADAQLSTTAKEVHLHDTVEQLRAELRQQKHATADAVTELQLTAPSRQAQVTGVSQLRADKAKLQHTVDALSRTLKAVRKERDDAAAAHADEVRRLRRDAERVRIAADQRADALAAKHRATLEEAAVMSAGLADSAKRAVVKAMSPERSRSRTRPSGRSDSVPPSPATASLHFRTPVRRVEGDPFSSPPKRLTSGPRSGSRARNGHSRRSAQ